MRKELIDELLIPSTEEEKYLNGEAIDHKLYADSSISQIDIKHLLEKGKLVTVRKHTRFIEFDLHKHNYVEMMYVVKGSITHVIDGKKIELKKGDFLLLNQGISHSILKASYDDIGINFICLPEFFSLPLSMLQEKNVLAKFITLTFQNNTMPYYLLFRLNENKQIENLMENMIDSMLHKFPNEDTINQYSMGLIFLYLLNNLQDLSSNSSLTYKQAIVQVILEDISSNYKNCNLSNIAKDSHQSLVFLSKIIKQETGHTFLELLQEERFKHACKMLENTSLSIEDIALAVGYENQSYFFRQFKKRYNMTPRQYRQLENKDSF